MSSLRKKHGKLGTTWEVLFYWPPSNRQVVRLGRVSQRIASTAKIRIESILAAKVAGHSLDPETAGWVTSLSDAIHRRIANTGVLEHRHQSGSSGPAVQKLGALIDRYVGSREGLKANTIRNYETTKRLLTEHFGRDRLIDSVHAGHARDYREWLVGRYAAATVAREIKRARQFFEYARDCCVIEQNPFAKIKAGSQTNTKRKAFVTRDVTHRVLEACPDHHWRLVVVLARYAGLRIPSELQRLTWNDIDWAGHRFTVRVPKKEHLDGHEKRTIPIFPEIEPYLRQAFEEAPAGSVHLLPTRFHQEGYVYAGVLRAVERAKITPWPKLLVNLRASRETELMRQEPAHVVHAWLGNSREVAQDHYLMVSEDDFLRAAGKVTIKVPPATLANGHQESSPETRKAVSPAFAKDTAVQIPPRGVEPRFSG